MKKSFFLQLLESRTILIIEACLVLFLAFAIGKEIVRREDVQSEVTRLEQQTDSLKKQNIELAQILKEMTSENFQEKEARKKLDVQKTGETVILLPQDSDDGSRTLVVQNSSVSAVTLQEQSNPEKWWAFFFDLPNS
ncbi:MAG: septum formation initiator family protein [Patescibacteria group bacterium]|jgi:cell division protein FtsB